MSVSKFDGIMKTVTTAYEDFQSAYKCAAAEDKSTCQLLLEVAGQLITIGASMTVDPCIPTLLLKVVLCGNLVLNVAEISKRVFRYFESITDDREFQQSVESDIKLLKDRKEDIERRIEDLGNIIKQLYKLRSILNVENTHQNQFGFRELIGEFDYRVHMISVDIERCQTLLASIEAKVNQKLNLRLGLVIGGSVASGVGGVAAIGSTVAAVLLTNPITAIFGVVVAAAVASAGVSVAGGVVAGVHGARRRSEMERIERLKEIKDQLIDFQNTIKSHVEKLNRADIRVANIFP